MINNITVKINNRGIINNVDSTITNHGSITVYSSGSIPRPDETNNLIINDGTISKLCGGSIDAQVTGNPVINLCQTRITHTIITPNPSSVSLRGTITFHATVNDVSTGVKSNSTGTVSWSDGGAGGSFFTPSCTLTAISPIASTCLVVYTTPTSTNIITINGTFSGDIVHKTSSGTSVLTVTLRNTVIAITPNPSSVVHSSKITFHARVSDTSSGISTNPTGIVSWSDGGAGGSFAKSTCTLVPSVVNTNVSNCAIVYTAPSTASPVTITGSYSGDSIHKTKSGMSSLTVS
jgi:hypothetical protein